MNMKTVALFAGVFFITLATFTQGLLPAMQPESTQIKVTKVVRTDLGELKWTIGEATDYTEQQAHGRAIYIKEGCWYCHSQFVRPVTGESRRWGPVSQSGESAFDLPHMFSTRRIGPDLTRVGLKYSDGWHLAHFWNPRILAPDSVMPRFSKLFDGPVTAQIITDDDGDQTIAPQDDLNDLFDFDATEQVLITPGPDGLTFVPDKGKYPVILAPYDEFTGSEVTLVTSSDDLDALLAYVQKLGTNRGKWRDLFEPQRVGVSNITIPKSDEWIEYGEEVYGRRCLGCHGVDGDGNGVAATFMKVKPRNFKAGTFKFRLTPSGSLPTDGDLLRTISRGVRGTAMPAFHNLTEADRLAVILYVKYVLAVDDSDPDYPYPYFSEEVPEPPIYIESPPEPSMAMVGQGREVWQLAKCWECHGDEGRGEGEKAAGLEDDFGYPIPPADLTAGLFKSGSDVADIYRSITTGLNGTPMPSYGDSFSDEDRWALAYFVTTLSAFRDPLSGEELLISETHRQALNDPAVRAESSRSAYVPDAEQVLIDDSSYAGSAWADRRGLERVGKDALVADDTSTDIGADQND